MAKCKWLWGRLIITGQVVGSADWRASFQFSWEEYHIASTKSRLLSGYDLIFLFVQPPSILSFPTDSNSTFGSFLILFGLHDQAHSSSSEVLMNEGQKSRQPGAVPSRAPTGPTTMVPLVPPRGFWGSLLIAALGMGQMVTTVQSLEKKWRMEVSRYPIAIDWYWYYYKNKHIQTRR